MDKRPTGKRFLTEMDDVFLKQKLCAGSGQARLDEDDLAVLRNGEAVFLWESPLAATAEEAEALARRAALEMAPAPGRAVLGVVMLLIADSETGIKTVDAVVGAIQRKLSKGADFVLGLAFDCGQAGVRFLLAASEGRADEGGKTR